ncbi:MAG: VTT domain-containing protein [Patescibacteria group bacterium]|jgi:membrane protein YqaA with SNARE-associated domain
MHASTRFLIAAIAVMAVYIALNVAFPQISDGIRDGFLDLQDYALRNGLWGMFVFSIAANATLIINIPYSSVSVLLAGLGLNPILIALSAGVGALVGEIVGYGIGVGGSKMLLSREKVEKLTALRVLLEKRRYLIPVLIFIFAAIPIPDYILLVPLGIIRYPFFKMLMPMLLGKIIQNFYFALLGKYSVGLLSLAEGETYGFWLGFTGLVLILGAIYLVLRINWDALLTRWTKGEKNEIL